ncbi:hypothetical protein BU073_03760 [Mammaliicoccus vitulinus]|uniref:Uncharacterized protein n=1 Tax=Mammaliicoccus vitulinus TaxID=71237 RepID=A0A2T4PV73_9STAP|nr:hypothetical protein BU072_04030 [Mammaliicoccus vitulinus]PTI37551.1 hypothetical protein BU074_05215 [Mammaliicoccus vitulinus]PTI72326.1 hypothetical protein BU073_03760 [Mammaliicoccus vitulinus]PTI90143.1 hypothetical protein BU071_03935 [Mammaliicoccus vitulinus]RIN16672.1 hypothetical protein BU075_04890 [Mammaliicoccus vitulinus]
MSCYFYEIYDFVRACLPRGMVRACSLSLILFPQASALHKIVKDIHFYTKKEQKFDFKNGLLLFLSF